MDHESILVVLPSSKEGARSMKEIALAIGLNTSTHTDWIRAERKLARSLRALINHHEDRLSGSHESSRR